MRGYQVPLLLTVAAVLLCSTPGCSRARWLSRKDYQELHDPFEESSEIAETDEKSTDDAPAVAAASGRSSLAEQKEKDSLLPWQRPAADSETAAVMDSKSPGPKPIQHASGSTADGKMGTVAQASYPDEIAVEAPGTARVQPFSEAQVNADDVTGKTDEVIGERKTVEAFESLPAEFEFESEPMPEPEISDFRPSEPSAAAEASINESATIPTDVTGGHQGLPDADFNADAGEFASWAESQSPTNLPPMNSAKTNPEMNNFTADNSAVETAADDEWNEELNELSHDIAQPLINPKVNPQNAVRRPAVATTNPFADTEPAPQSRSTNPFAEFDRHPQRPGKSTASQNRGQKPVANSDLDAGFEMDSGWKPSHAVNP